MDVYHVCIKIEKICIGMYDFMKKTKQIISFAIVMGKFWPHGRRKTVCMQINGIDNILLAFSGTDNAIT